MENDGLSTENQEPAVDTMSDQEFDEQMDVEFGSMNPDFGKDDSVIDSEYDDSAEPDEDEPEAGSDISGGEQSLDDLYKLQMEDGEAVIGKPILVKINGETTEIANVNDMKNLIEKGLGATKSFQQIAEHKKTLQFMEENNISMDDLNHIVGGTSTTDDLGQVEDNNVNIQEVENVANDILQSEYADDFKSGLEFVPSNIKEQLTNDPALLKDLAADYESGIAQKIIPQVEKLMAIKGLNFFQAYAMAGQSLDIDGVGSQEPVKRVNKAKIQASPRGNTNTTNSRSARPGDTNVWDLDDEQFDKYFKQA